MMATTTFAVGDVFDSFDEFITKLKKYEEEQCVQHYLRHTRTISASRLSQRVKPELKYTEIGVACIYGGRPCKDRKADGSSGQVQSSSIRIGCPYTIRLATTRDRQQLVVKRIVNSHNHEVSKAAFKKHPAQRRLTPYQKSDDNSVLDVKLSLDKTNVRLHPLRNLGRVITMKELHNLVKSKTAGSSVDLTETADPDGNDTETSHATESLISNIKQESGAFSSPSAAHEVQMNDHGNYTRSPKGLQQSSTSFLSTPHRAPRVLRLMDMGSAEANLIKAETERAEQETKKLKLECENLLLQKEVLLLQKKALLKQNPLGPGPFLIE